MCQPKHLGSFQQLLSGQRETYEAIIADLPIDEKGKSIIRSCWLNSIKIMERLAFRHMCYHDWSNVVLIVASAIVPALLAVNFTVASGHNETKLYDIGKIAAMVLSVAVAILHGVRQSYKFSERVKNFRRTAEKLKLEGERYFALGGTYSGLNHQGALPLFIQTISAIRDEQIQEYIQKIVRSTEEEHAIAEQVKDRVVQEMRGQAEAAEAKDQQLKEQQYALERLMKAELDSITSNDPDISFAYLDHAAHTIRFTVDKPGYQPLPGTTYTFKNPVLEGITYTIAVTYAKVRTHQAIKPCDDLRNTENSADVLGALGCVCTMGVEQTPVLVTCFHVLKYWSASWNFNSEHASVTNSKLGKIGTIIKAYRTQTWDVAVVKLSDEILSDPLFPRIGQVKKSVDIDSSYKNRPVQIVSRTRGGVVINGVITEVDQPVTFDYKDTEFPDRHELHTLIQIQSDIAFSKPGDSGSLVVDSRSNQIIGMIVGGDGEHTSFAIPFKKIETTFLLNI